MTESDSVSLRELFAILRSRAWVIILLVGAAVAVAATLSVLRTRRFEAETLLATVNAQPTSQLAGAAALLGGAAQGGGLQLNPTLVARLFDTRRVLLAVARSTWGTPARPIAVHLVDRPDDDQAVLGELRWASSASVSKETGLLRLSVTLTDSALAREIATRMIREVTAAYVAASRSQATQQRLGQEQRVDSALRYLSKISHHIRDFRAANREIPQVSGLATVLDSLQRELAIAEQVYSRAVADREVAVAKELENTPVLVSVDPLPETLPKASRNTVLFSLLAGSAAFLIAVFIILVTHSAPRSTAPPPPA